MHQKELAALVAGASVGVGGGALGAFLVCTAGRVVARGVLDQFGEHYIALEEQSLLRTQHGAQQASADSAPGAPPAASDLSLPLAGADASVAPAYREFAR